MDMPEDTREQPELDLAKLHSEPTPADYRRSGIVIAVSGLITALIGLGFYSGPHGLPEFVAACFFWVIALVLVVVGTCEAAFANSGGRPFNPRTKDRPSG